ncbi:aminopeptidase P family protein [Candidatus Peregrinibacteria bacterium]|nr:aminopeptidase P family protein [Candidatus Peregrinibacteria bacterium]
MRPTTAADLLRQAKNRSFLVTNPTNVRYLTGLPGDSGYLLIVPGKMLFFVDELAHQMATETVKRGITVKHAKDAQTFMARLRTCGFEEDTVTIQQFRKWKKKYPNIKFVQCLDVVEEYRRSKDAEELRTLHRAERITEELLRRVPQALRKGITEEKLARQLTIWALELGAEGLSFDPIVAFGTHTGTPHHVPTSRRLKKGHIVQIDVGAKLGGYCADRSEVYFTKKPTALQERVYLTLCEARDAAMDAVRPGVTTHALDKIARKILKREGIEHAFTHGLGHGVGLDIHEGVILSQKAPVQTLLKHEVITIEPGVYFAGKFGMRVESMVYVA